MQKYDDIETEKFGPIFTKAKTFKWSNTINQPVIKPRNKEINKKKLILISSIGRAEYF